MIMTPIQIGHEGDGEGVTSVFCRNEHLRLDEIVKLGWITEEQAKQQIEIHAAIMAGAEARKREAQVAKIVADYHALPTEEVEAVVAKDDGLRATLMAKLG